MANVSSFSGTLILKTSKEAWSPDDYIRLYDILMAFDCGDGSYGLHIADEDIIENSASFLAECLGYGNEPEFGFWGNGRWSAEGTLRNFDNWTSTKQDYQTMSEETYQDTRTKLLEAMYEKELYLELEYVDEESGFAYINREHTIISVVKDEHKGELYFNTATHIEESHDFTVRAYSEVIEENREGSEMLEETLTYLYPYFEIQTEEDAEKFKRFILDHDFDESLTPYYWYENIEDVPVEILLAWKKLKGDDKNV